MPETKELRPTWIDGGDGWRLACIRGHNLRLRQTGAHEFQFCINDQEHTRRGRDISLLDMQASLVRTAMMLPPR